MDLVTLVVALSSCTLSDRRGRVGPGSSRRFAPDFGTEAKLASEGCLLHDHAEQSIEVVTRCIRPGNVSEKVGDR